MIAQLIGKSYIYKSHLPDVAEGDYWIQDEEGKRLVNIIGNNGKWAFRSNNEAQIINPNDIAKVNENYFDKLIINEDETYEIPLENYDLFYVALRGMKDPFILFCTPSYEEFTKFEMKEDSDIFIGSNPENDISYNNTFIAGKHAMISFKEKNITFENYDINYGAYINDRQCFTNQCYIFNGDIIFIMGLRIVVIGKYIFVNNPLGQVKFRNINLSLSHNEPPTEILEDVDDDVQIYSEKDYFLRSPRITNIIEHEDVKIDPPPAAQNQEDMPLIMVLGTSLSMGAFSMVSLIPTLGQLTRGETTFGKAFPSIMMSFTMIFMAVIMPAITRKYQKKKKDEYEEKRQVRYREYITKKIDEINTIRRRQRDFLFENYLSAEDCRKLIISKDSRLWERKSDDKDFLMVRLGLGVVPLDLTVSYPEKGFTMDDDNLMDMLNEVGKKSGSIKDAPITISLCQKNISALVIKDNPDLMKSYLQNLVMQLITFHSYDDFKIVFLMKESHDNAWESMKLLPHVWDNTKQIRFFADDYEDMKDISQYLEQDYNYRVENTRSSSGDVYKNFRPYYLIITDDYKKIRHLSAISKIVKNKTNLGFSMLCLSTNLVDLPDECKTFICLENDTGFTFESDMAQESKVDFKFTPSSMSFFESTCREISTIPIKYSMSEKMILRNSMTFLELYDVGRIEQLNVLQRWKTNDPTKSLAAPLGVDNAGMPIVLDIHEKAHGPHGLIAGSTGSGKSEFIITYILSLCLNYHPYDVAVILIDYKGGGLAGAFQKGDIRLPHLVGTITNIDTAGLQRSLASIQSELRRRQVMFNEARNKTDGGTIDIYKYQRLYHDRVVDKPIPHLLIICDEFAELKQQQPEFMDELISVARIGRSLGVHLILATQKPAGIVNEQIRSNSRFAICLKVQDKSDSMDVIKRPDAAELKEAGQFYMQVGNNEYFTLGIAAWSGALYYPSDVTKKRLDGSIKFISNIGRVFKQVGEKQNDNKDNLGDQLTNIVKYMDRIAKNEKIVLNNLWVDNIPEEIFLEDLRKKYNIVDEPKIIKPVIGEFDDPGNQRQGPVMIDLSNGGNLIVYGNAYSGKETFLSSLIFDIISTHKVSEANIYIMDFGSEALKIFKGAPQVGDIVFVNDDEKIGRLFEIIVKEIRERVEILSDYGGDYNMCVNSGRVNMPLWVVIINNFESFSENYLEKYDDIFLSITREGMKCGVKFVITASSFNDLRYRLSKNFEQKIALQLSRDDDYYSIWDGVGKKRPPAIFGRGLIKLEDIYEMQTAKITKGELYNEVVKLKIEELKKYSLDTARPIPSLPEYVDISDISYEMKDLTTVPIGISKKSLKVYKYDFTKNLLNIISAKNIDFTRGFITNLVDEIKDLPNIEMYLFDCEGMFGTSANVQNSYRNFCNELNNNSFSADKIVCIVTNLDKFITTVATNFEQVLTAVEPTDRYTFIIVDSVSKIKGHEYDTWYKKFAHKDSGIWIGNGMGEQYIFSSEGSSSEYRINYGRSFGYAIKQDNATLIKLLGVSEEEEVL